MLTFGTHIDIKQRGNATMKDLTPFSCGGQANREEEYRKILGVTNKDTPATIKTRYKELLTKYHPDKVQHLGVEFQEMAERKTKAIMEAYEFFQKKYNL